MQVMAVVGEKPDVLPLLQARANGPGVDAIFIAMVSGSVPLAAVAASGFALTWFLQRFVPGD